MHSEAFQIHLPIFEGPFDLLLFFIQRDELDIYDIPIAKITNDFLAYCKELEKINIELSGEFILVASTLMRIKAQMLLPRMPKDEHGQIQDPRTELIDHILLYQKFKEVSGELSLLAQEQLKHFARPMASQELEQIAIEKQTAFEMASVSLYKLLTTYLSLEKAFQAQQNQPIHKVEAPMYSQEAQGQKLLEKLQIVKEISVREIFISQPNRLAFVYTLLAMLELVQRGKLKLVQTTQDYNVFGVCLVE